LPVKRSEFVFGAMAAAGSANVPAIAPRGSALDRFMARPTPEYRYQLISSLHGYKYRARVFSMVSQQWRSSREVDRPEWTHWLVITEPEQRRTNIGVLIISGGSTTDKPPKGPGSVVAQVARRTGAAVIELYTVPNQPLTFSDTSAALSEDDLVAYSWNKYLHTLDDTWPLHLPMAKAAVKAMDTVTALVPSITHFVVGGASKRGWAAWLTAAADRRVAGVVPVVIDTLNVARSAVHGYRAYGFWPPALKSYEKFGIMKWFGTPQLSSLLQIEDPYVYRARLTMPKLIVNAAGDQFFAPDSSQFYYHGLPGKKYLRYVPNADHSLAGAARNAAETGLAFLDSIFTNDPGPVYDWKLEGGELHVHSKTAPVSAKLWHAVNAHARDFRLEQIGRAFKSQDLRDRGGHAFSARLSRPHSGFAAYFIELTYDTLAGDVFTVTTDVNIVPDVLPFAPPPMEHSQ
jgi:PhoPQ-activated pathogenicity-related protein